MSQIATIYDRLSCHEAVYIDLIISSVQMADPVTAIGLASNIIQLISFTSDIVSKSREIYKSQDGKLIEHMELEAITNSLQDLGKDIVYPSYAKEPDETLRGLCAGCDDISRQLLDAIQGLQAQGTNKRWISFRQALKTIWNEDKIEALSRRLDRYRAQIDTTLLVSLTTTLTEHIQKMPSIDKSELGERISVLGSEETKRWLAELIEAVQVHGWERESQQDVANFSSKVSATSEFRRRELAKAQIYEKLRFTDMGDRYEQIEDTHKKTFEWIFNDPNDCHEAIN